MIFFFTFFAHLHDFVTHIAVHMPVPAVWKPYPFPCFFFFFFLPVDDNMFS